MHDISFDINGKKIFYLYSIMDFEQSPLLFICKDENDELYICLNSEIRLMFGPARWLISKLDIEKLEKVLIREIDIRELFNNGTHCYIFEQDKEGNETVTEMDYYRINELDLPDIGAKLEFSIAMVEEVRDFINTLN